MIKSKSAIFLALAICTLLPAVAFAQEAHGAAGGSNSLLPIASAIAIGLAALGGTISQGKAASSALEAIGRNPAAAGNLQTPMLLALAFIESLVVLSFVISFFLLGKI